MAHKRKTKKDETLEFLETALVNNTVAIKELAKKKSLTIHDLKQIKPLTEAQRLMFESYFMGNNIVANGSAGTGKSYIAIWLALNTVLSQETNQNRIIILRSAVPTRNTGFLPGSNEEKMEPYENPYRDIVSDLTGKKTAYDEMKKNGSIVFMPTSYLRGLTWDNAVIIVDETQSQNMHEINTIMTRCGKHSKLVVIGDFEQNDLIYQRYDQSGFPTFLKIAERMSEFDIINFTRNDIIRSKFVKSWICAYEDVMNSV